jgi:PAS domain-containing protein
MRPVEPSPLLHCWPNYDRQHRFVLGRILDPSVTLLEAPGPGPGAIGRWECDLATNRLTWSDEVYDIFGLPRGGRVSRDEAVSFYCEHSRAVMEGLRAHAIRQQQGFILDAEIRPGHGERRWMRLIGLPIFENGIVTRLRVLKQIL